jgi:hypothetical protein
MAEAESSGEFSSKRKEWEEAPTKKETQLLTDRPSDKWFVSSLVPPARVGFSIPVGPPNPVRGRRRVLGWIAVVTCAGSAACILIVAAIVHANTLHSVQRVQTPKAGSPAPIPAVVEAAPKQAALPAALPAAPAKAAAVTAPAAATTGELRFPQSAIGHRAFVDGKPVGDAPASMRIACGPHSVRVGVGSKGRSIDVPCGGSIAFE